MEQRKQRAVYLYTKRKVMNMRQLILHWESIPTERPQGTSDWWHPHSNPHFLLAPLSFRTHTHLLSFHLHRELFCELAFPYKPFRQENKTVKRMWFCGASSCLFGYPDQPKLAKSTSLRRSILQKQLLRVWMAVNGERCFWTKHLWWCRYNIHLWPLGFMSSIDFLQVYCLSNQSQIFWNNFCLLKFLSLLTCALSAVESTQKCIKGAKWPQTGTSWLGLWQMGHPIVSWISNSKVQHLRNQLFSLKPHQKGHFDTEIHLMALHGLCTKILVLIL